MGVFNKVTIEDIEVKGKKVLVRVDFNVPLNDEGRITDDGRIEGALPTIRYLVNQGAKIILVSHLGRPKKGPEAKFSMKPVAVRLSELLGRPVQLASDVIGEDARKKTAALKEREILLLENVRFHPEEEANDPVFAKQLAELAEIYVDDAFGSAHRAHASTAGIAEYLPAVCGFLLKKEIDIMGRALTKPEKPFVAIMGGAKVSDKINVIENLLSKIDVLIIGGGMAYTFLKSKGFNIGTSIFEEDKVEYAGRLVEQARAKGVKLLLPVDNVVAREFKNDSDFETVSSDKIADGWMGMDIGPATIEIFAREIKKAKTVIWNGPMGVFEMDNFANGTREIARAVAESGALSIVGGGDSAAAVEQLGFSGKVTHTSTGGGATLEFLAGNDLPGLSVLMEKKIRETLVAGNWKMNKTPSETTEFIKALKPKLKGSNAEVVLCVPAVCIPAAIVESAGSRIKIGAQNIHWEESGAYTGEISAAMLVDLGVQYIIIGHSERRQLFFETDDMVNKKVKSALKNGLKPIICVGETLDQREQGITEEIVKSQVKRALSAIEAAYALNVSIAYEPIWAIGTGKTATAVKADDVCAIIRETLSGLYGKLTAENIRILYGGSVTATSAVGLFGMPDIDGGLIGGASLKLADFIKIAKSNK